MQLVQGIELKYREQSFNAPLIKVRINQQNFQVKEDINPHKATWRNNLMSFETGSLWDIIELRIYETNVKTINLVTAF